jgi:hypothetical protein
LLVECGPKLIPPPPRRFFDVFEELNFFAAPPFASFCGFMSPTLTVDFLPLLLLLCVAILRISVSDGLR